jgi:hypothetical protein
MVKDDIRCATCQVHRDATKSAEPACCVWFMDNVICGNKTADDCPVYEPMKGEK